MDINVIDDGFLKLKVHMLVEIGQKLVLSRMAQGWWKVNHDDEKPL